MSTPIEFYFDFSSPYGYFMSEKIDAVGEQHGRDVQWRPFLLGAVFKETGGQPLTAVPMKAEYADKDLARTGRFLGLPFQIPSAFPVSSAKAARAFYWLEGQNAVLARNFAKKVFKAYFVEDQDISQVEVLQACAEPLGVNGDELAEAIVTDDVKAVLKNVCAEAIERKVFGSPFVIIDGEPFWGVDRLPQIEVWLAKGGF